MTIFLRLFLYGVIGAFLGAVPVLALASFPASPPASTYQRPSLPSINMPTTTASNMVSLTGGTHCQVYFNSSTSNTYHYLGPTSNPGSACSPSLGGGYTGSYHAASNSYMFTVSPYNLAVPGYNCPNYTGATAPLCTLVDAPYTCPPNSTISGSGSTATCTCNSGFDQSGSTCVPQPSCPVNTSAGIQHWFRGYDTNLDGTTDNAITDRSSSGLCVAGCVVKGSHLQSGADPQTDCYAMNGAPTKIYCSNNFENTGALCSASPAPAPDTPSTSNPCPTGQTYGTVNGIGRCLASSSATTPPPAPTTKSTTSNTVDNGNGTSTTTTITTTNNSTTTTTTIINNTTGATVSSTTTEKLTEKPKTEQQKFCEDNPNSPMCKISAWGGSCGGYTCDGDAVQCAIARLHHQFACDADTSSEAGFYRDGVSAMPTAGDAAAALNRDGSADINVGGMWNSEMAAGHITMRGGACPAPVTLTFLGYTLNIEFDLMCAFAEIVRYLLLAAVTLLSFRILLGRS
jgi:hypothetical protein